MIKVFIIDDHQMLIDGIRFELDKETDIEWMGNTTLPSTLMAILKE